MPAKGGKHIRTGYFSRVEWPMPGGVMQQLNHVVEIFQIINHEEMVRQGLKFA